VLDKTAYDKPVDIKPVDIDDAAGDDALAGTADGASAYTATYRAAAGHVRRFGMALAQWCRRTAGLFVHAWQILRTEGPLGALRHIWQFFITQSFSSLTRRIVVFNVGGLLAFVLSILYLTQIRAGVIEARLQTLLAQGETMSVTIAYLGAESAPIKMDLDRLFRSYNPADAEAQYMFSLPPDQVAPLLRRWMTSGDQLARIYDPNGLQLLDSRTLSGDGFVNDAPVVPAIEKPSMLERPFIALRKWLARGDLPVYHDIGTENGKYYKEVVQALDDGKPHADAYINDRAQVVGLVAVPIQRAGSPVRGVLLLSTRGGDIDHAVEVERLAILKVFLIAAGIITVLSMALAGTIAGPVRKLADSADLVRRRVKGRVEILDFTDRRDEIGHLSGSLREMTRALYDRIDAIESFAADVAHELKNPLTSLRSAVETLPLARTDEKRGDLLNVIKMDVQRLNRLISDISDASRLDAELQRQESAPVDMQKLLVAVVALANDVGRDDSVRVILRFEGSPRIFKVQGHDSRLGQVMNNLIDNARSFSPPGGTVRVTCRRTGREILTTVDDDGPGIRPDAIEKIFERFYTDRPQQHFGQNSGLGLSISKQIVKAHDGYLSAQNRVAPREPGADPAMEDRILGARFSVRLPAM
jgi:two-component system, OmpR family, sensor histidine kinase ChvG